MVTMGNGGKLLKIYKAKPYMGGRYTCRGWNQYGRDVKTVTVNVQGGSGLDLDTGNFHVTKIKVQLLET